MCVEAKANICRREIDFLNIRCFNVRKSIRETLTNVLILGKENEVFDGVQGCKTMHQ